MSAYGTCHVCGADAKCTAVSAELIARATESGYIPFVPRDEGQRVDVIESVSALDQWLLCRKCISALQPYLPEQRESQGPDSRANLEARIALMLFFRRLPQDAEPSPPDPKMARSKCFIATAACGTDFSDEVVRLREFREMVLLGNRFGRAFVRFYEMVSPPAAWAVSNWCCLRGLTRQVVVRPAASLASVWLERTARRERYRSMAQTNADVGPGTHDLYLNSPPDLPH